MNKFEFLKKEGNQCDFLVIAESVLIGPMCPEISDLIRQNAFKIIIKTKNDKVSDDILKKFNLGNFKYIPPQLISINTLEEVAIKLIRNAYFQLVCSVLFKLRCLRDINGSSDSNKSILLKMPNSVKIFLSKT